MALCMRFLVGPSSFSCCFFKKATKSSCFTSFIQSSMEISGRLQRLLLLSWNVFSLRSLLTDSFFPRLTFPPILSAILMLLMSFSSFSKELSRGISEFLLMFWLDFDIFGRLPSNALSLANTSGWAVTFCCLERPSSKKFCIFLSLWSEAGLRDCSQGLIRCLAVASSCSSSFSFWVSSWLYCRQPFLCDSSSMTTLRSFLRCFLTPQPLKQKEANLSCKASYFWMGDLAGTPNDLSRPKLFLYWLWTHFEHSRKIRMKFDMLVIGLSCNDGCSACNIYLQMSTSGECIEQVRSISALLEGSMQASEERMKAQYKIYTDLYRIFSKHATKLATLANSINEEVLASANQEELTNQYSQMLSNSLLRLADSSRRVSLRFKSEVLDPLKTFNENYENIYEDIRRKIAERVDTVVTLTTEHAKLKQSFNQAYEKFDRHKEGQRKVMEKVESGSKSELEKFNANTKKLTENISASQKFYLAAVEKLNNQWDTLRKDFALYYQSITYNENTKVTFFRKTVMNSIKTLEEFNHAYEPQILKKIEQAGRVDNSKNEDTGLKKLKLLLEKVTNGDFKEEFQSYDEAQKAKKKKVEEEVHLAELFSKLKEKDKKLINELVTPWFNRVSKKFNEPISPLEDLAEKGLTKSKSASTKHLPGAKEILEADQIKEKIISEQVYSFYFVQLLYQRISDMTSFYCKLNEDNFFYVLNAFTVITNNIDPSSELGIEFLYKMMVASQRILLRKSQAARQGANQPIELLCIKFSKTTHKFRDAKLLTKLLAYIEKRKSIKKKGSSDGKGTFNIAKGFLAAFTRKNPILTQDEVFTCLQELIKIIANFSVPNEIVLPFIKDAIGNTHQSSYEYLKAIILNKKDVEERQSLFYRKEIKEKKEELLKKALENKRMGEYALTIVAHHGFLGRQELHFRSLCRQLSNIHLEILARLRLPTTTKWIRLIPVNRRLEYIQMKQEVAERSVPSAVEEIITLDVNRSLHLHGESLNPTILHSLLRIYAHFHPDISYCQGMNYLAGYIYIKTMNEQYTYRIFEYLMEVRFKEIFINEFEVLKVKMYQFERLLAIFHTEISEHFKRQCISPECYIVSWIITLFASSYQYTLSSFLIDFLWERFIIWGWPEFFRFVLWVFSLFKEDLVELTYDRALHFLGELGRSDMFLADEEKFRSKYASIEDPKVGIERYQVSEQLLNKFTQEYQLDKK